MLKYCRAECYKALHRIYPYGFLLAMFLCEGLLVAGWVFTNANGNDVGFSTGAGTLAMMLSIGLYCTILIGDIVFSDQYKTGTLKNEISYGVPRSRIFLGKLIVECLTALVLCAVVIGFYLGLCWLLLPHSPEADGTMMQAVSWCLLCALPLWLGAQALTNLAFFTVKSSTVATFAVVGVFLGVGEVLRLLGALVHPVFQVLHSVLLTTPLDAAASRVWDWAFFGRCCAIGAGWFIACTALGLLAFRKREIN